MTWESHGLKIIKKRHVICERSLAVKIVLINTQLTKSVIFTLLLLLFRMNLLRFCLLSLFKPKAIVVPPRRVDSVTLARFLNTLLKGVAAWSEWASN